MSLIIFMFTLLISINAYSINFLTYNLCDYDTYSTCGVIYFTYYTCDGYITYSTCSFYGYCDLPELPLPYTMTHKTCLKTGCTEEVCMTDLFQNPLSYFYEYPYGYHAFYLLKPVISGIGEKRDAMGTSEMCMPDMFIWGVKEKKDMLSIPLGIAPDIFLRSEPAAPPAY